jgi:hypothetical protein
MIYIILIVPKSAIIILTGVRRVRRAGNHE